MITHLSEFPSLRMLQGSNSYCDEEGLGRTGRFTFRYTSCDASN